MCLTLNKQIALSTALNENANLTVEVKRLLNHKAKCGEDELKELKRCRTQDIEFHLLKGKYSVNQKRLTEHSVVHDSTNKICTDITMSLLKSEERVTIIDNERHSCELQLRTQVDMVHKQVQSITKLEHENKACNDKYTECEKDKIILLSRHDDQITNLTIRKDECESHLRQAEAYARQLIKRGTEIEQEKKFCTENSETCKKQLKASQQKVEAIQSNLTKVKKERDECHQRSTHCFDESMACSDELKQCKTSIKELEGQVLVWQRKYDRCWLCI